MTNDLLLVLIGLGVIAIIAVVFIVYTVKKSGDKKEAKEFLNGLSDTLLDMILDVIRSFDPEDIPEDIEDIDLGKIETAILKRIYETCWTYVTEVVKEKDKEDTDFFTKAVLALLENKDFVEQFIADLINNGSTKQIIYSRAKYLEFNTAENRMDELEEREQELSEEFSDQDKYVEESNEEDLPVGEDDELNTPTEEEVSKLNPQRDEEEEELDPDNDTSVEVIDEFEDVYYDKSGRARSKKTGKWTKDPRKQ